MELIKKLATTPARPVESFDQIKADAFEMIDMLDKGIKKGDRFAHGVALHHAQVSEHPFNFFVVADDYKKLFGGGQIRRIVINPKITDQKYHVPFEEGCLSFLERPYLKTRRFEEIAFVYQYVNGSDEIKNPFPLRMHLTGFPAFMVQHECDHGQGLNIHDGRFDEYNPRVELDKAK